MPTIGWFEILIVVAVSIIIIGPKDFPIMLKKVGSWFGSAKKYIATIQRGFTNLENEVEDVNENLEDTTKKQNDKK